MTLRKWQLENLFDEDATAIFVVCTIISQTLTKVTLVQGDSVLNCNFAKKGLDKKLLSWKCKEDVDIFTRHHHWLDLRNSLVIVSSGRNCSTKNKALKEKNDISKNILSLFEGKLYFTVLHIVNFKHFCGQCKAHFCQN